MSISKLLTTSAREAGKRASVYPGAIGFVTSSTAWMISFLDVVRLLLWMDPTTRTEAATVQATATNAVNATAPQTYNLAVTKHAHETDEGVPSTRASSDASTNADIKAPGSTAPQFDRLYDEFQNELNQVVRRMGAEELASIRHSDAATLLNRDASLSRHAHGEGEAILSTKIPADTSTVGKIQAPDTRDSSAPQSNAPVEKFQKELSIIAKRVGSGELAVGDAVGIIKSHSVGLPAGAGYAPFHGLTRQILSEPPSDRRRRMAALLPALIDAGTVSYPGTISKLGIKEAM